jgi:imidazoleglycerol phosphate dehydratase HisB
MRCLVLILQEGGLIESTAAPNEFPRLQRHSIPSLAAVASRGNADLHLVTGSPTPGMSQRSGGVETLLETQGIDIQGRVPLRSESESGASAALVALVGQATSKGNKVIFVCGSAGDEELGRSLGAEVLRVDQGHPGWTSFPEAVRVATRRTVVRRSTRETAIVVNLALDGAGNTDIQTGIGFFDHMLDQLGRHSGSDLIIHAKGDLQVDEHHTIEDTGITLGQAFRDALGDKRGLARYAFVLPMDESVASVSLDFGDRSWLVWDVNLKRERIGDMPTEMVRHFFKSFTDAAACTLHVSAAGENEHHIVESVFKSVGRCLGAACRIVHPDGDVPSTKGSL